MKKILIAGAGALTTLGTAMIAPATAGDMAHAYEITVTNTMAEELIAPVLVTGTESDAHIFTGNYVTPEAEEQVLTGDPKKLVERIGAGASVAHGEDGPPGVLLAPGKSLTFTIETAAPEIRLFAMVAPTMKPDNYLTATVKLKAPMMDGKSAGKMDDKTDTMAMAEKPMADKSMKDAMMTEHVMVPDGRQLMMGDHGERVAMLRKRLGLEAMGANADIFDADVKTAVMDYQSRAGLQADGIVGRMTLKALNHPMDAMMKDDTMMDATMKDARMKSGDTMSDGKDAMKDTMMKTDSMAKDSMEKASMEKDSMAKDSIAENKDMMMSEAMTTMLHRFDIGHDEKTMAVTAVEGTFGTVSVKPL